jgi:ribosomal 50S subunit-recycling heat shock protein
VRIDIFLKRTGLVKQRTLAKEWCERGCVTIVGQQAKAGREVRPGDLVRLETAQESMEIEIVGLPDRNYKRRAGEAFYEIRERRPKPLL